MKTTLSVKSSEIRGVTFLPNGQRCETWVPAGTYAVLGTCTIASGRDAELVGAAKITDSKLGTWYVALHLIAD